MYIKEGKTPTEHAVFTAGVLINKGISIVSPEALALD